MSVIFERYGFHFTPTKLTTKSGEPMFLVVKMKGRSTVEAPRLMVWEHSEDEYVSFINEKQIKAAMVMLDDFSFLTKCPDIEMLDLFPSLQAPNHISYEPIYQMPSLRFLGPQTVYGYDDRYWTELDCGKLASASKLEFFAASCRRGINNISALTGLKTLHLSSYNKANNLKDAVGSATLDSLSLLMCRINSLEGIQITKALQVVKLDCCYKLENIDALYECRDTVQGLIIDSCTKIKDYSVLGELKNLTRLSLIGSGKIQSLAFLDRLPKLKNFHLSINVEDGDLSYCDRLESVSIYPNRRHYNRKDENFHRKKYDEAIRGDEGIEEWRQNVMR